MLLDALKYLSDLGRKSADPKKLDIADPWHGRYVIDGKIEEVELPTPPRDHQVSTLADLISLANRFSESGQLEPVVWFDETAVVLVIDDPEHRVEKATLRLETSSVFRKLEELEKAKEWTEQKPFVRLLRIDMASALEPAQLLSKVKRVTFDTTAQATGHVGRHSESLGRSISSRVETAEGELPDTVILEAPVYKTAGESALFSIRCSVEVDSGLGAFRLLPLPDELTRVRQQAVESIRRRLNEGANVSAYYGKP